MARLELATRRSSGDRSTLELHRVKIFDLSLVARISQLLPATPFTGPPLRSDIFFRGDRLKTPKFFQTSKTKNRQLLSEVDGDIRN